MTKALSTFALLLGLCWTMAAQDGLRQEADAHFELKDFKSAIPIYLKHIEAQPSDKNALIHLAQAYEYTYNWDNAARWYYEALGHSVPAKYLLHHGKLQMMLGRYEAAKAQFLTYANVDKQTGENYARMCDYAYGKQNQSPLFRIGKPAFNTNSSEFSPTFFREGLAYVSGRKDVPRNNATVSEDEKYNFLFTAPAAEGQLPTYVRSWLHDNDLVNEGPVSYSADGKWVAYVENHYLEGVSQMAHDLSKTDIFIAMVNEGGDWENPQPFPFNGTFSNSFPHLSADGQTLYYASKQAGGLGGFDLYISKKQNGKWQQPVNMGNTINTPGNEISPFMNGKDLYFSSDYHMGFGGQDIFKARFDAGTWKIQHLGTGINGSTNDYGYILQGDSGYFVSDRDGQEDIFSASQTFDEIKISVKDAQTGLPIENATLDFKNCNKGVFFTNDKGLFGFKASEDVDCWVGVAYSGYERRRVNLSNDKALIDVKLYREGQMYLGKVSDGSTAAELENVRIKVLNQNDGKVYEVFSGTDGIYTLALSPASTYMLQYDKMGYVNINTKVNTGDGSDKGILGSQLMFSTQETIHPAPTPTTPEVPVVENPAIHTPPAPSAPSPSEVKAGYAVQLLSLSLSNNTFPSKINQLEGHVARVYVKKDMQWQRYRAGTYATKSEANSVLGMVKTLGFPKAFIVKEDQKGNIELIIDN